MESPQSVGPESADTNPVDPFAHSSEPARLCENASEFESSFDLAMLASDEDSDCEVEKDIEEQSLSELDEIESMVDPHENLDLYEEVEGACLIEDGDGQFEGLHVAADDNIQLEDEYFQPLYEGATVSICAALVAIMHFKNTCKLPFTTIQKLLLLLRILCPNDSKLPSTVYKLRKFFQRFHQNKVKTLFCSGCQMEKTSCTCLSSTSETETFIQLDLPMQFRNTLSRKLIVIYVY